MTKETARRIVVTTLVSENIMNIAAINTPKFQPKLTNQLIVLSSLFASSNPSGSPAGRGALFFFSFFSFFSLTGFAAFATAFAFSTGLALAAAFAFALAAGFSFGLEAAPALSNNPIISLSLIHLSDCSVNLKI